MFVFLSKEALWHHFEQLTFFEQVPKISHSLNLVLNYSKRNLLLIREKITHWLIWSSVNRAVATIIIDTCHVKLQKKASSKQACCPKYITNVSSMIQHI